MTHSDILRRTGQSHGVGNGMQRRQKVLGGDSRASLCAAALLSLAALGVYLASLTVMPLPGTAADLLASAVGAKPNLSPQHGLWSWLVRVATGGATPGLTQRAAVFSALFGAVSVGLTFLLMLRLLRWALAADLRDADTEVRRGRGQGAQPTALGFVPWVGAAAAALAVGFSSPFWVVATRTYPHTFYIAWLLCSALLWVRFVRGGRLAFGLVWAFVHAAGMTQTSAFWTLSPLLAGGVLLRLWTLERLTWRPVALLALAALGGLLLLPLSAWLYRGTDGALILGYGGLVQISGRLLAALRSGILGSLPRVGWMMVAGLAVAPALVALTVGRRALRGELDWAFLALHLVIGGLSVAVLLNIAASPWRMLGVSNATILPTVLAGMTFGYVAAYFFVLPLRWVEHHPRPPSTVAARSVVVLLVAAFTAFAGWRNRADAVLPSTNFLRLYADSLLDHLEGREWLATNGVLDDVLLLRAHERGIPLRCLDLTRERDERALRAVRHWLESPRLKNASRLGLVALVEEWIRSDPDAPQKLALMLTPDLWLAGGYRVVPSGLLFLGATDREWSALRQRDVLSPHRELWHRLRIALDDPSGDEHPHTRWLRNRLVRTQTSFVGNNLGVMLDALGRRSDALEVFATLHRFDPGNVSVLLNWAALGGTSRDPEVRQQIQDALDGLRVRLQTDRIPVWSLSRVFGYVIRPDVYEQMGWVWARSGRPGLAVNALQRAQQLSPSRDQTLLHARIAQLHVLDGDLEQARESLDRWIEQAPEHPEALLGLAQIELRRGELEAARAALGRAAEAGAPGDRVALTAASIAHVAGDSAEARSLLQQVVERAPDHAGAWALLCAVLAEQEDLAALHETIGTLQRLRGREDPLVLTALASRALLVNDIREARDFLVRACRVRPNSPGLLEETLRLDFLLADRDAVESRGRQLLRLQPDNSFANYLAGSLRLAERRFAEAEDAFRRSIAAGETFANLNDLAMLLYRQNRFEEALEMAGRALLHNDRAFHAWDTLGTILMALGRLEEAEEALHAAMSRREDPRLHLRLGQLALLQGDRVRALEHAQQLAEHRQRLSPEDLNDLDALVKELHAGG